MRRLLLPVAIVTAVNALMLAAAWSNRAGQSSRLEMTEREVGRPFAGTRQAARDTSARVILHYEVADDWRNGRDRDVMPALGFRCTRWTAEVARSGCGPKRRAYLALEYDGPAWRTIEARRTRERDEWLAKAREGSASAKGLADGLDNTLAFGTRLVAIDAALDAEDLRRAHPQSNVIILPATAEAYASDNNVDAQGRPLINGTLLPVTTQLIAAGEARAIVSAAEPSLYGGLHPPRYRVALRVGRRHEMWIEQVTPIDTAAVPR